MYAPGAIEAWTNGLGIFAGPAPRSATGENAGTGPGMFARGPDTIAIGKLDPPKDVLGLGSSDLSSDSKPKGQRPPAAPAETPIRPGSRKINSHRDHRDAEKRFFLRELGVLCGKKEFGVDGPGSQPRSL